MYRRQLREFHDPFTLRRIYRTPHNHQGWIDHRYRVKISIGIGRVLCASGTIVDLSAGDGAIARGIASEATGECDTFLGDIAYSPTFQIQGPIEDTLDEAPPGDLFICSETLEHVVNPEHLLYRLAARNEKLLISTPIGERGTHNVEHYWGWDEEAVRSMLEDAGWRIVIGATMEMPGYEYKFQFWGCDRG